jgi:hypothetical protein
MVGFRAGRITSQQLFRVPAVRQLCFWHALKGVPLIDVNQGGTRGSRSPCYRNCHAIAWPQILACDIKGLAALCRLFRPANFLGSDNVT